MSSDLLSLVEASASQLSGGAKPYGEAGWAIASFGRAHFYEPHPSRAGGYLSACGTHEVGMHLVLQPGERYQHSLFKPGTWKKCKLCMDELRRRSVKAVRRGSGVTLRHGWK